MIKHGILCVDDEADNVDSLERLFRRKYQVFKATSGAQALEILAVHPVSVIISDQRMPEISGVEFLTKSILTHPEAIRILLTGYTDINSVIDAINSGQIYRYVTKPWDPVDLLNAVDKAVERFELGQELREKNEALTKAIAELQTLDEAKNQFMVLINHELKTPLTSILSFSDLLNETTLDADQKLYLTRIRSAAHRLQQLTSDALDFVSAETGVLRIEKKQIESARIFTAPPEGIEKLAEQRQIKIHLQTQNATLIADERIMRNVYQRLLHNAVKFADAETDITVEAHLQDDGYHIQIRNTGKPLDTARIEKWLKPFTIDENVMHHTSGTGMGLAISRALLNAHQSGGTKSAASKTENLRLQGDQRQTMVEFIIANQL